MKEWILILTLQAGHSGGVPTVVSVPGFKTEVACIAAAVKWTDDQIIVHKRKATAFCASNGGKP